MAMMLTMFNVFVSERVRRCVCVFCVQFACKFGTEYVIKCLVRINWNGLETCVWCVSLTCKFDCKICTF